MPQFMFATGVENSYPTIQWKGKIVRQDELAKTKHYECWQEDFRILRELGIQHLRYGPPYYKTHTGPGKYDWDFTDQTFKALHAQKVTVIADLCHFGVPDWIGNFQNGDWPKLFADYAGAFAERFPWVRFYTPVNEIFVAATFSAQLGWWNERLSSDAGFVTALKHLCRANVMAMHAILAKRPDAIFIQSESTQYFHPDGPDCEKVANFFNEKRFLSLDLTYGSHVNDRMYEYLLDNGMTRDEYHWFLDHHCKSRCVMGNDYYATNENLVHSDGSVSLAGEIFGYYPITHQYFSRYRLPVMHTETNGLGGQEAVAWLRKEWANVHRLKLDGVPLVGFTWYSLQDQVDWDTGLREDNGRVNPLGLCDLSRKIRPVGHAYKALIHQWRDTLPTESNVLGICQ
ncbi:MAG TPA: family 1 glycosylhydrolase [Candidatus Limnocylindrales bacterium]|nr:family 1 glycosylhydrolase [Candidatus Limnocylindrales bacterium]